MFIGGEWIRPKLAGSPVYNPSIGDVISECPMGGAPEVNAAGEAAANTTTLTQDVIAYPFGQSGLMAGLGLEGSKITPIHPN